LILAAVLCLGLLALPAAAASFPDIADGATARNVEVLRLMGVLEGDEKGNFNPTGTLTRAQFCKMSVVLLGKREEAGRYASRTIFPDVRASHWAAPFVNFASASESKFIHGMPDGTFSPESTITYGQAVTILMRLLGYEDKDAGAVWPDGYVALADANGVAEGLNLRGGDPVTRSQAARLFVNTLTARTRGGVSFAETLGTLGEETVLVSADKAGGKLVTRDNPTGYPMVWPVDGTIFAGVRGRVLTDAAGRALTFLPTEFNTASPITEAAVILSEDGSSAGFDALTGGNTVSAIYRNGTRVERGDLRKYDVVGYSVLDNSLRACDVRVAVYYEDCAPSPAEPTVIEVLGGTRFQVLSTAWQSLSRFKPGDAMILQLTADGRVAGAMSASGAAAGENAMAFVDAAGQVGLLCAGEPIPLKLTGADVSAYLGQAVRLRQTAPDSADLSRQYRLEKLSGGASGELNAEEGTLGSRKLSEGVLIFDHGTRTFLKLLEGVYAAEQITYAHLGDGNRVDLIVMNSDTLDGVYYGRAVVSLEMSPDPILGELRYIAVENGSGTLIKLQSGSDAETGSFVRAEVKGGRYVSLTAMTEIRSVPASAWIGSAAVTADGVTYDVPSDVPCFNRDTGRWMTGVRAARDYDSTVDLYVADGAVRAIAVGG
jgi:hypothetical protein